MKLSDTFFSFTRFAHLCYMDIVQNWKKRLMTFVVIYGVQTFVFLFMSISVYSKIVYSSMGNATDVDFGALFCAMWFWVVLALIVVYPTNFMHGMKSNAGRVAALMVPATTFEKFFLRWLVCTIHFSVSTLLAFFLADLTRSGVCMLLYPGLDFIAPMPKLLFKMNYWENITEFCSIFGWLILGFCLLVQSFYALGSVIWRRNPALKTTLALFVLGTLCSLLFSDYLSNMLLSPMRGLGLTEVVRLLKGGIDALTLFYFLFTAVNWVISYFRFKELEIIDRW